MSASVTISHQASCSQAPVVLASLGIHAILAHNVVKTIIANPTRQASFQASSSLHERIMSSPVPESPTLDVPSLFMLIFSAVQSFIIHNFLQLTSRKEQIQHLDKEESILHQKKIEQYEKEIRKQLSEHRWSTSTILFSWMTSFLEIFTGIALIGSGNPVGVLLLFGGLLQLTNHIMQYTKGWEKIAELLPGDDPAAKKLTITRMQIGLGLFALILGVAGGVMGGMNAMSQAMQAASVFSSCTALFGMGVSNLGQTIVASDLLSARANVKACEKDLEDLGFRRHDIMEAVEECNRRIGQCFALIASMLHLKKAESTALQKGWR